MMLRASCAFVATLFPLLLSAEVYQQRMAESEPVLYLNGSDLPGENVGKVEISKTGPLAPEFPEFGDEENPAIKLKAPSYLKFVDEGENSPFDFDQGETITVEAWVNLTSFQENAYILGKGRTNNPEQARDNQNWAFRLRKRNGAACVNFLFRSRAEGEHKGDWHRWTSDQGFTPGSGWHHVAVSYEFGDPESIRGYLNGELLKGDWDMGGKTTQPPVVDNDEVWLGSSMAGARSNSFEGEMDEVALYRRALSEEELKARYQHVPQPLIAPEVPDGQVVVQLFGPIGAPDTIPKGSGTLLTEWQQDWLGFTALPKRYDDWGIRADWGQTLLVRSWADVELPAGEHELMVRTRGLTRLWIDDEMVLTTKSQRNRGGGHNKVVPLPELPREGMRTLAMNDQEMIVDYASAGKTHRVLMEMVVGGPRYRPEFGETSLSLSSDGEIFRLLGAGDEEGVELTDAGWESFTRAQSERLASLNTENRRRAGSQQNDYWQERHEFAQARLEPARGASLDDLILSRVNSANAATVDANVEPAAAAHFHDKVDPIFAEHCYRCHGEKEKGGLNLQNRENMLEGGDSGIAAIVPGDPFQSFIVELVGPEAGDERMPPKGDGLSDAEIAALEKWVNMGAPVLEEKSADIQIPELVDDHTFLRRVYLDTVGVNPTLEEAEAFLADNSPDRREKLVDRLLEDPRWADNWMGYWQDVLAENPNLLKPNLNNTGPFRWWIHEALTDNRPMDRFATELIMMRGSTWAGGTAGFGIASQNDVPMAAKAHIIGTAFLAVEMKCARCHDSPYHEWKQADLFQLAAMLEKKPIKVPESSSVPAAFFENQPRKSLIEVTLDPGVEVPASWPFAEFAEEVPDELLQNPEDSRERLAAQVTTSQRFAEVLSNRLWSRFMGQGIVEPVDDWEGNPPSNPQLLSYLSDELVRSGYDMKHLASLILKSDAYRREAQDVQLNVPAEDRFFAGPYRRRMSAEQIVDTAFHATGNRMDTEPLTMDLEGSLPPQTFLNFGKPDRAWEFTSLANERDRPSLALPRAQAVADVLAAFGWRNSRQEPTTHREEAPNVVQPGVLANGVMGTWLTRLTNDSVLTDLCLEEQPLEELVRDLSLQILTRPPTEAEMERFVGHLAEGYEQRVIPEGERAALPEPTRLPHVSWSNHLHSEANVVKVKAQELAREGDPPTNRLQEDWRLRAEDVAWALLNSPEMVMIP